MVQQVCRLSQRLLGLLEAFLQARGFHSLLAEILVQLVSLLTQSIELLLALSHTLLGLTEGDLQAFKLAGQGLDLQENLRVLHVCPSPCRQRRCCFGNTSYLGLFEALRELRDYLLHPVSDLRRDCHGVVVENLLDDTSITQESFHGVPRSVSLAKELHHGTKNVHNRVRRDSEVLDFVQIGWFELADGFSSSINLWLNAPELTLNISLPLDNDLFILCASLLQLLHLCLSFSLLFHGHLDSLHSLVRLGLLDGKQLLLLVGIGGQLVNSLLSALQLLETCFEMTNLASASGVDQLEHVAVALDEIDEDLRTDIKLGSNLMMDVNAAVYHLLSVALEDGLDVFQLRLCNDSLRLFGPPLTPDNYAFVEERGILRTVCLEPGVLAVKGHHYREVSLHPADKELEKSPIFILVPHFV